MPENPEAIKKTYDAALGKLQAILFSLVSTSAERKASRAELPRVQLLSTLASLSVSLSVCL